MKHFLLCLVLVVSCGKRDNKNEDHSVHYTETMDARHKLYCELSKPQYDAQKWVVDECDGAGFTSLYALVCPENGVDLSLFQSADGRMHRSPNHSKCWDYSKPGGEQSNGAKAGFSKDHVLMRAVAAFDQKDIAWFESFLQYNDDHGMQFCDAIDAVTLASRCILPPTTYVMFKSAIKKLKAEDPGPVPEESDPLQLAPQSLTSTGVILMKGFEAHLDIEAIRLKGRIYGGVTDKELKRLQGYAARETRNGLYLALAHVYGQVGHEVVWAAMDDESHWPKDKLPSDDNHCETFLFSRDYIDPSKPDPINPDWLPCPARGKVHSGTDYGMAMYVLKSSGL